MRRNKPTVSSTTASNKPAKPSANSTVIRPEPETSQPPGEGRRLVTREFVMGELGVCYSTVIRLEKSGVLPPIKLYPSQSAKTFYQRSDLERLMEHGHATA